MNLKKVKIKQRNARCKCEVKAIDKITYFLKLVR